MNHSNDAQDCTAPFYFKHAICLSVIAFFAAIVSQVVLNSPIGFI